VLAVYIACPKCDWRPDGSARWVCTCGHVWNTFQTHGVCPGCGKVWTMTACSSVQGCGQWSDHEEWYHDDDSPSVEEFIENPQRIVIDVPSQ
jgi:hypothetical protein